jgi:tetratricopeptide (TPR) repeat protein
MKLRVLAILGGILLAGTLSAQTLTEVINEFNTGVEKLNNQEYAVAIDHFNQVITLAETVGAEADDMKGKAEEQIPATYYRQATTFMKRKQYDNAIPFLEQTVEFATLYNNNEEIKKKASGYLPQLYVREGTVAWKNQDLDQALVYFDKALGMNPNLYQAHQGKGLVYLDQDETSSMLEEFALAKAKAEAKGDTETIEEVNGVIDSYYNKFIQEEFEMVDPEDNDYTYVVEACENALAANPQNPRAFYYLAAVNNKSVEYDAAIENALKGLEYEQEPIWMSGLYFELGNAYQNTAEYEKACEALQNVVEEPFLARAEKKMGNIPGCN